MQEGAKTRGRLSGGLVLVQQRVGGSSNRVYRSGRLLPFVCLNFDSDQTGRGEMKIHSVPADIKTKYRPGHMRVTGRVLKSLREKGP